MKAVVLCVLVGCGVSGPSDVQRPTADELTAAETAARNIELEREEGQTIAVDLNDCVNERLFTWLPFGSMWILVHERDSDHCELWLGGETENPQYNGSASQYCLFYRRGTLQVGVESGGPAYVDEPSCIDL